MLNEKTIQAQFKRLVKHAKALNYEGTDATYRALADIALLYSPAACYLCIPALDSK